MASPLVPSFEEVCFGSAVPIELSVALAANDFFCGVDGSLVRDYATLFRIACLPAGTLLHGRKRRSTCVFLILDGAVQIEYCRVGESVVGETLHVGRFTGEASLLGGQELLGQVTSKCLETSLLCWARAADLMGSLHRSPQIALNVARSLHARVAAALAGFDEL